MKKLMKVFLSLFMVFGILGVNVYADEKTEDIDNNSEKSEETVELTTEGSEGEITFNTCDVYNNEGVFIGKAITDSNATGNITIPSVIEGSPVVGINEYAFKGRDDITGVTIPDGVTTIGEGAFYQCSNLESVTIPDSVTLIDIAAFEYTGLKNVTAWGDLGAFAFSECPNLESVVINGCVKIAGCVFRNSTKLTSVTLPSTLTRLGNDSFENTGLKSITIPGSVKKIEGSAFERCTDLESVIIQDGVTDIGYMAFYLSGLKSIKIPDSVTKIDDSAFMECVNLESIDLPEKLESIAESAFSGCTKITSVEIPDGVTAIESGTFAECKSLTDVKLPSKLTWIGEAAFAACSSLKNITIPDTVTSIEAYSFTMCSILESIKIPEGVTTIGECAFQVCNDLSEVTIPSSVTYIGFDAFSGCGIENIFYAGSEADWAALNIENNASYLKKVNMHYNTSNHVYSTKWTIDKAPTCAEEGVKSHHCMYCDATADVTPVAKTTDHKWSSYYVIDREPTAEKPGLKSRHCLLCGATSDNKELNVVFGKMIDGGKYTPYVNTLVAKMKIRSISRSKGGLKIKWKKNKSVKGYQIRYSTKSSMKSSKTIRIGNYRRTSKKLKNLKRNTRYYIQIRAYLTINGKRMYGPWSDVKSRKTK